ncbi:heterokaryon incompatibility protein-domain-containing protein [Lasiosphaeria ovina]|uniref:Heterokaryon incompatibility protein-domain-containing protein n=1 Tax=Lasiosphaeria ovina TaxID=92902 RepID=A0AAE0K3E5_9PEZI|nr:heterokaryon incompatibility protein-domain-containing protein [Lasiosphaeria ovina]
MKPFIYRPINRPRTIRLLKIFPGDLGEPIKVLIRHACIDDSDLPEFSALSYTWGSSELSHSIECRDSEISITASLHAALHAVRYTDAFRVVWADGVCINQTDNVEKASQVCMMKDIYRRADEVTVYLGETQGGEDLAIQLLGRIYDLAKELREEKYTEEQRNAKVLLPVYQANWPPDPRQYGLPPFNSPYWEALEKFLLRPWFTRVWIVQEFALADAPLLTCGNGRAVLPYWYFGWLEYNLRCLGLYNQFLVTSETDDIREALQKSLYCMNRLSALRACRESGKLPTMMSLLGRGIGPAATDARDHVFGYLGIAEDCDAPELQPDYTKSVEDVFVDCCKYSVQTLQKLDFLYEAGCYQKNHRLPSWVPDWTTCRITATLGRNDSVENKPAYDSTRDMPPVAHFDWGGNYKALVVRGSILSKVATLGSSLFQNHQSVWLPDNPEASNWYGQTVMFASVTRPGGVESHIRSLIVDNGIAPLGREPLGLDHYRAFALSFKYHKSLLPERAVSMAELFGTLVARACYRRRFCITTDGLLGQVPIETQKGDGICLLSGTRVPFVVRSVGSHGGDEQHYQLVGECYIDGLMYGEGLNLPGFSFQDITLV